MKKLVFILSIITLVACKTDKKEANNSDLKVLSGKYLYYADAAILQTENEVYGVVLNKKTMHLNEQVKPYKVAATDMVYVELKGKITPKPEGEEGWPNTVEIVEILKVTKPKKEEKDIIILGK